MTYREQIRSPKWIEFAAKFKASRGWKCESCDAPQGQKSELSVHHVYYIPGVKMWDHPEEIMECLCWACHKQRQPKQQLLLGWLAYYLKQQATEDLNVEFVVSDLPKAINEQWHEA